MAWSFNFNNLFTLIMILMISGATYWFAAIRTDKKVKQMEPIKQEPAAFMVEARIRANRKKEIEDLRHEIEKAKLEIELEQLKMQLPIKVDKQ